MKNIGELEEKIAGLMRETKKNPESSEGHFELACALLDDGNESGAVKEFNRVLELDKDRGYYSIINYKLGLFYYREQGYDKAIKKFEKSAEYIFAYKEIDCPKQVLAKKLYFTLGSFLILRLFHGEHSFPEKFRELRKAKECFCKSIGAGSFDIKLVEKIFEVDCMIDDEWNKADKEWDIFKWYNE